MEADKEEIRARNDIVEVIGAVVQLRKRGRNWVGLCPFHQEKTPSFNVDPVTQTFKCFGCDASGDVFTFVQRHQNMSFVEAAEYLARRAGVTFAHKGAASEPRSEREVLYEVNSVALTYFRDCLARNRHAMDYVRGRMLLPETIEKFGIGYAPDSWEGLTHYLEARKVDLPVAAGVGLVAPRKTGDGYVDVFRNRIMFPIYDEQMRVVGFGGRALGDEDPKYRNSPESPVFAKNRLLYALPFARRAIGREGRSLILEGYVDVITAHQAGFDNAVATLGTALTAEHARRLARLAPAAIVAYDADAAGIKAALRAAAELEQQQVAVRIARLPQGEDPDSLIRSGHPERFARAIDEAVTRVQMELDIAQAEADTSTDYGRQQLIRRVIGILATLPNRTEREVYVERVWQLHPLGAQGPSVAKEQLHRDIEEAHRRRAVPNATGRQPFPRGQADAGRVAGDSVTAAGASGPDSSSAGAPEISRPDAAEMAVVRALALPQYRAQVLDHAEPDDLLHEVDRMLIRFLKEHPLPPKADEAELVRHVRLHGEEGFAQRAVERLQESQVVTANEPLSEKVVADAVRLLRDRRTARLEAQLRECLQSKTELTEQDRELVRELHRLRRSRHFAT